VVRGRATAGFSSDTEEDVAPMTAPPYDPMSDGQLQEEFVEKWRDAAYGCFSSGHKFCREVCPVMQVTRNENHTPTAFHANIVAMEQGNLSVADVADDYVHCTQCGACELRCPNTLFTGDFYRHRTRR
jgi:heterodisulfide reductase subunit D